MNPMNPLHDAGANGLPALLPMALFDQIGIGLIVCDGDGWLHLANRAARLEFERGRLLRLAGRQLRRADDAAGDLAAALRQAAQRGRRTLVRLTAGDDRLLATTMPCPVPGHAEPQVLVTLGRRQACNELDIELLGASYGLTAAERRVLAALVRELPPAAIAERHAVKLSTVRTQIGSIRAKFGTRSVDGLLLRAAEVPPVAPAVPFVG